MSIVTPTSISEPAVTAPVFNKVLTEIDTSKYEEQLEGKVSMVRERFSEFIAPHIEIFRSEPKHYRMRAEFSIWHDQDDAYYYMHEPTVGDVLKPQRVRVDQFPVASMLLNELMSALINQVKSTPILKRKLFQVNFQTTLSGDSMVTLIYHRKLDEEWKEQAAILRKVLKEKAPSSMVTPKVIGRSRKQKMCLDKDEVEECLAIDGGQTLNYIQVEGAFSQPNGRVCQHMLSWARSVTLGSTKGDLLELYCGNGNFTVALAQNFRRVVATEVSKSSVAAAKRNLILNGVENVFVARMSSEEFTEAWKTRKAMKRLEGLDFGTLELDTLLVDPPRAGLDDETLRLLPNFKNVVYISCNPETLHENLKSVKDVFQLKRLAVFDQFPYTHHIEGGALLERKSDKDGRGLKRPASEL